MSPIPFWKNKHLFQKNGEINIWRLQALFQNFRRILQLNNGVLEKMAILEQAQGGELIFDWNYLTESVRLLAAKVHHIVYNLNALTGNSYIPLYDTYQEILTTLENILSENHQALSDLAALPLADINWALEPLVGINLVCMAELQYHHSVQAAEGFIITSEGCRALYQGTKTAESKTSGFSSTRAGEDIGFQFQPLLDSGQTDSFTIMATRVDDEIALVSELGRFSLEWNRKEQKLFIHIKELVGTDEDIIPDMVHEIGQAEPENQAAVYVEGIRQIIHLLFSRLDKSNGGQESLSLSLYVRPASPLAAAGEVSTTGNEAGDGCLMITAYPPGQQDHADVYYLRRTYPFELVRSHIIDRAADYRFSDKKRNIDHEKTGLTRGSALLMKATSISLSETAIILERLLGTPVSLQWELTEKNHCVITSLLPAKPSSDQILPSDITEILSSADILCQGGQTVQAGNGAGKIIHVSDESAGEDFPAGAIAVAHYASPQLTPVLQRAAAVVTEYGSPAGHLATVARELRLPAIFGLPHAMELLPQDKEVTVVSGDNIVYAGILDVLLQSGNDDFGFSPFDREYRTLRRMLRFIMPLNLVNPDSPSFTPAGCRSFHDIIHFCHEKAVDELAHFQERHPGLGAIRTKRMQLKVPMDIRVLDIGGGMNGDQDSTPRVDDVRSQPFSTFLDGLLQDNAWNNDLPSLGLRDIFSAMPRSMGMLNSHAETLGENLAIVGHDYINLSLRLGYHFSVIDAHLGSDTTRNYVYFRFAGGLSDTERRQRRARFIQKVLAAMDFIVSVKGDLVVGRKKSEQPQLLSAALYVLGALTAFSKQRDTTLYTEEDVENLFTIFNQEFLDHYTRQADQLFNRGGS